MEVTPGFKRTEVGVIPEDWDVIAIGDVGSLSSGTTPARAIADRYYANGTIPWVKTLDLNNGEIHFTDECVTDTALKETSLSVYPPDTVLVAMYGGFAQIGRTGLLRLSAAVNQALTAVQLDRHRLIPVFLLHVLNLRVEYWKKVASSSRKDPNITSNDIRTFSLGLPTTLTEQEAIAGALTDADTLIDALEQLVSKKRQIKHGAMQELLTGRKRLPGFTGEWEEMRIADIASPSSQKNTAAEPLPVLTCSKHLGFVDSLAYFKNQVFSHDTSGYKVIRRGQLGYPANHIEEGSIGLQNLYDVALVSPIYVVFSPTNRVNSYFLHRLLKMDSYRGKFETATSASVDRRGSLRWPAFSHITVSLPKIEEQAAIAAILSDMDAEIAALEAKLAKARRVMQGMMQELLTGRVRLV